MAAIALATIGALAAGFAALTLGSHAPAILRTLVSRQSHLSFPPNRLSGADVILILTAVVLKSLLSFLGAVPRLELRREEQSFALPLIEISAPVEVGDIDQQRYQDAVAVFRGVPAKRDERSDPPTLLLAALTTPLMLLTLASYRSPILPLGSVNARNRFEFLDTDPSPLSGRRMLATASFGGPRRSGRQTRRGIEFDIVVEVMAYENESLQDATGLGRVIFRQHITITQALPKKMCSTASNPDRPTASLPINKPTAITEPIQVPYQSPRLWAKVCKDYNPIHVSALAARACGYPGRMAHGNHVVCAVLATLAQNDVLEGHSIEVVEVAFKRPMVLPLSLSLSYHAAEAGGVKFELRRADKVHVEGTLAFR